ALQGDRMDARTAERFEKCFAVGTIGLVATDVGPHVLRRNQHALEAEGAESTAPVMTGRTGLQDDAAGLTTDPEPLELRAEETEALGDSPGSRGDGDLEDLLGQVNGDGYSAHRGLLSCGIRLASVPG